MTQRPNVRHHAIAAAALALAMPAAQAVVYNWNSGDFTPGVTAPGALGAADVLDIGAGSFKFFNGPGSNFTNAGTVNWRADNLYLMGGVAVLNNGLWNASSDDTLFYNGGAAPSFINNGTFRKSAGTGSTTIGSGVGFVNNGTLDAQTGRIDFVGGSVFNAGSVFTGAGSNVAAGSNSFNGAFSSANLVLQSGVHAGNAAVVGGNVAYTGGTLSGNWRVPAGQTVTAGDGVFKMIDGGSTVLTNQGTVAWNSSDILYLLNGATLANQGTLRFSGNGGVLYNGGSGPSFINTGLIAKTGGSGTTTIGDTLGFDNLGTVDVQTGTIALPSNFTNRGTLKGDGSFSVAGTLNNIGSVKPGATVGTLGLGGSYAQGAAGIFEVDLTSAASHDLFSISGSAALGGQLTINCWGGCSLDVGEVVTILDAGGTLSGTFANVVLGGFATGAFDVIYDTVNDRVQLLVTEGVTAAVPEPGGLALFGAGLALLGGLSRRRLGA